MTEERAALIRLLHEVDGQLGLVIHRNTHDDAWKIESQVLISRIRVAIKALVADVPDAVDLRWPFLRTGRTLGRTIYGMEALEPSNDDTLIGIMDTPELAQMVVDAYNASTPSEPTP